MKKFFLWILMVLVLLGVVVGGTIYYFYDKVDETSLQKPALTIMDGEVLPSGGDMYLPVLSGITYKRLAWTADQTAEMMTTPYLQADITAPAAADKTTLTIKRNNKLEFEGSLESYADFSFPASGVYEYRVACDIAAPTSDERPRAYGRYIYEFRIKVEIETTAILSHTTVSQGEVLAVRVLNNLDDIRPTAQSTLGDLHFIKVNGDYTAYLPISHNQETGEYLIAVQCGEMQSELSVNVEYVPYSKLEFADAASLPDAGYDESAAAIEAYRSAVWPLYETISTEALWDGRFIAPVTGTVSFDYGMGSLLPGQKISSRHSGQDYRVNALSVVVAPNAGKVVFSGTLALTGETVIIEHGGGIKSYLYYLTERSVQTGDTVTKGQTIAILGNVEQGGTLHYEVRIGNKTVSPGLLISGDSALLW